MNRRKILCLAGGMYAAATVLSGKYKPRRRIALRGGTYRVTEPVNLYPGDCMVGCTLLMDGGYINLHGDANNHPQVTMNSIKFCGDSRNRYAITLACDDSDVLARIG